VKRCECQSCKKNTNGIISPSCYLNTLIYDYNHPKNPAKICVDYESKYKKE